MSTAGSDAQDRQAMAHLAAGHDAALDELMARHAEPLFRYLMRVLQNETEASDLAEESFVRVYQNRERFKAQHKFSTWLYTIATNLARDVQRSRARHPHVSLDAEHAETGSTLGDVLPEENPNPGEALETSERAEVVRRAVAALEEDLRLPLVLAEYEGKSHVEIGEILDCSPKAVEMRIYRARGELRKRLGKLLE